MNKIYLTQKEFKELPEYSLTVPTGVTIGKQWKRHVFSFEIRGIKYSAGYIPQPSEIGGVKIESWKEHWFLGEYAESENKDEALITWRKIIIKNQDIPNHKNALNL